MNMIFTTSFGYAIIRITSPILFAALAAVVAEKAGVTNIGLEGTMMFSSLFGVLFAYWTNNWFVGVLAAMVVGVLIALIMGIFALKLKTNIILAVTGTPVAIGGLIGDDREIYITLCNVNITSDTTSSWYSFTKEKGYEYKVDLYVDNSIIRTEKVPDVTYNPI